MDQRRQEQGVELLIMQSRVDRRKEQLGRKTPRIRLTINQCHKIQEYKQSPSPSCDSRNTKIPSREHWYQKNNDQNCTICDSTRKSKADMHRQTHSCQIEKWLSFCSLLFTWSVDGTYD